MEGMPEPVRIQANAQVFCDDDGELMQAHAVGITPNMRLAAVVYTTTLYRCTLVKCRRAKTLTSEVRMPHP